MVTRARAPRHRDRQLLQAFLRKDQLLAIRALVQRMEGSRAGETGAELGAAGRARPHFCMVKRGLITFCDRK